MERRNPGPSTAPTATAESVAKLGISMTVWGKRGVTVETAGIDTSGVAEPWRRAKSMLGEDEGGAAVGGGADLEEAQGVGHHR